MIETRTLDRLRERCAPPWWAAKYEGELTLAVVVAAGWALMTRADRRRHR